MWIYLHYCTFLCFPFSSETRTCAFRWIVPKKFPRRYWLIDRVDNSYVRIFSGFYVTQDIFDIRLNIKKNKEKKTCSLTKYIWKEWSPSKGSLNHVYCCNIIYVWFAHSQLYGSLVCDSPVYGTDFTVSTVRIKQPIIMGEKKNMIKVQHCCAHHVGILKRILLF